MRRVEDFESEDEILPNRLKLSKYLRELVGNQRRIFQAAADRALKLKQESGGITEEKTEELIKIDTDKLKPFLEALELKMEVSKTPFLSSKNEPSKRLDKAMFDEIRNKELHSMINTTEHPCLFAWYQLIS